MALIRRSVASDLPDLPAIEQAAALLLRDENPDLFALFSNYVMSTEDFRAYLQANCLWVAVEDQRPVGFIAVSIIDAHAHIDEVDVLPNYGRRGIGRALINTVSNWATEKGRTSVTLSTQKNVPWNAPFYTKLGFTVMPENEWTAPYRAIRQHEANLGFPMADRILMIYRL